MNIYQNNWFKNIKNYIIKSYRIDSYIMNIVCSRYNKNVDFIYKLKADKYLIYDKVTPSNPYNIPVNKGQEASVYLKYIIDHYDDLPEFTFFMHDDEYSWHHSGSMVDKFYEAVNSKEYYYNVNDRCILGDITTNGWYPYVLEWYNQYIQEYIPIEKLPHQNWTDGYRGSAQFLVHKSLILNLPKQFYEGLYDWTLTAEIEKMIVATILEWCWHIFWVIYPNHILVKNS